LKIDFEQPQIVSILKPVELFYSWRGGLNV